VSTNTDIHHLAAAYALDAVDDRERAAFEAHYPSCDVCRTDVLEYRDTLAQLADAAPVAPGADVRDRVLAEIARTRQLSPLLPVSELAERRRRRRRVLSTTLAAAAAMVLVVAGALLVSRDDQPAFADELAAVLAQPDARLVPLDGDAGTVRVVWSDEADRAAFLADDLPAAPDGEAYELWLIDDGGAVPMHLLDPAADGEVRATFDIRASPVAWGVTLEPVEGSAAPTGEILYVAEV
jgi:anti-sigma-K factor RskA